MGELEKQFLSELSESLADYVAADFFSNFAQALHDKGRRAIRLNFLRIEALGPLNIAHYATMERASKLKAGLDFLENWQEFADFRGMWQPVPWADDGFYVPEIANEMIAKCQAYKLGLYYLQESSAMLPANLLAVKKGEIVADYCAAPGGKSGKIASDLAGSGCLLSNDLALNRARIMLRNLNELAVWHNVLVNADLHDLALRFKTRFTAIVLDVPCSGEGMIRRDPKALKARLEKDPKTLQALQLDLLKSAWQTLKPGGRLVYSTCTFNCEENEAVIYQFLQTQADAEVLEAPQHIKLAQGLRTGFAYKGCQELKKALRIFPQDNYGEGHFAVLLHKKGDLELELAAWPNTDNVNAKPKLEIIATKTKQAAKKQQQNSNLPKANLKMLKQALTDFIKQTCRAEIAEQYLSLFAKYPNFKLIGESVEWLLDLEHYDLDKLNITSKQADKLHVLSEGIWLGQLKIYKNVCKFVPSHNWALLFTGEQCLYEVKTNLDDMLYQRLLQGQSLLPADVLPYISKQELPPQTTYALLTVNGFSACWLQLGENFVKILYPKQWLDTI